jgi:WD40 repeat protein
MTEQRLLLEKLPSVEDESSNKGGINGDGAFPPQIPTNVFSDHILPFVGERRDWNSICSTCKEFYDASKLCSPPWPIGSMKNLGDRTSRLTSSRLSFSPCGKFLLAITRTWLRGAQAAVIELWDSHRKKIRLEQCDPFDVNLDFSCDGRYLVSVEGFGDILVRLWPMKSILQESSSNDATNISWNTVKDRGGIECRIRSFASSLISCLSLSPTDPNILAIGLSNGLVKIFDVERKECINAINNDDFTGGGEHAIAILSFSPRDSARILIGNGAPAGCLRMWDPLPTTISDRFTILNDRLATLRDAHNASEHCRWINAAYSHCGSFIGALLFAGRYARQMRLVVLKSENMTVLRETDFEREMSVPCYRIVFSPDDNLLVVTGGNRGIVFFADNLKIKEQLPGAMDVAFHPTQDLIASCSGDGTARLLDISSREEKIDE